MIDVLHTLMKNVEEKAQKVALKNAVIATSCRQANNFL